MQECQGGNGASSYLNAGAAAGQGLCHLGARAAQHHRPLKCAAAVLQPV